MVLNVVLVLGIYRKISERNLAPQALFVSSLPLFIKQIVVLAILRTTSCVYYELKDINTISWELSYITSPKSQTIKEIEKS